MGGTFPCPTVLSSDTLHSVAPNSMAFVDGHIWQETPPARLSGVWKCEWLRTDVGSLRNTTQVQLARCVQLQDVCVTIQKHYRGWAARKDARTAKHAISIIQASWRAHMQRRQFLLQRSACLRIQNAVRGWLIRLNYLAFRDAIICLQVNPELI